jgi:hypothetical protein
LLRRWEGSREDGSGWQRGRPRTTEGKAAVVRETRVERNARYGGGEEGRERGGSMEGDTARGGVSVL